MGYRSDVDILFYPDKAQHFPVMKLWLDENMPHTYLFDVVANDEVPYIHYNGYQLKWYEAYPEVQDVEDAILRFGELFSKKDSAFSCQWEFVRIGEDYDDIKRRGSQRYLRIDRNTTIDI